MAGVCACGWHTWNAVPTTSAKCEICIISCDFWGLPSAGGTATSYHHLAQHLASEATEMWPVTFLAATNVLTTCEQALGNLPSTVKRNSVRFECLKPKHMLPTVVETFPYEAVGVAIVRWLLDEGAHCDLIHAHEWGGGLSQLAILISTRPKPGLRLVIEPHGGHFWSTQGTRRRVLDLFTLRIDDHERITLQFADDVKSPSAYMLAYFRQRGFTLPRQASVIPNIIPHALSAPTARVQKQVWRLAFFGRLEERKGLKVFCEAVELLDYAKLPSLEIMFVGSEALIDMLPSTEYLEGRTFSWPMPVEIHSGLPRLSALALLRQHGILIVFSSLVENFPYALAEACIEQIPFVTFSVGGVAEMLQPNDFNAFVAPVTACAMYERIDLVLHRGWAWTSILQPSAKLGDSAWQEYHTKFAQTRTQLIKHDQRLQHRTSLDVIAVLLDGHHASVRLKQTLCAEHSSKGAVLIVPEHFRMLAGSDLDRIRVLAAQLDYLIADKALGAFAFGARLSDGGVCYPSSPTWMLYQGGEARCAESVPILLLSSTFCSVFLSEANDFELYTSWLLIHHLRMAGLQTAAFHNPVFVLNKFSDSGSDCLPDNIPNFRKLYGTKAFNLLGRPEDVLMKQHLALWPKAVASFREQFGRHQGHNGWRYIVMDDTGEMPRQPQLVIAHILQCTLLLCRHDHAVALVPHAKMQSSIISCLVSHAEMQCSIIRWGLKHRMVHNAR